MRASNHIPVAKICARIENINEVWLYDIRIEMLPRAVFRKWQELKIKEVGASMVVVR